MLHTSLVIGNCAQRISYIDCKGEAERRETEQERGEGECERVRVETEKGVLGQGNHGVIVHTVQLDLPLQIGAVLK